MAYFTTQVTRHRFPPVPRFAIETPNYQIAGDMFIKKNVNKAGACLNIWQTNLMLPFNSLNSTKTHQHLLNMTVKRLRRIMMHLHRYKTPLRENFTRVTTQRNLIMPQQVLLGCGIPESNSSDPPMKNLNSGGPKIFIVFTMDELRNILPGVRLHKTRNIHREGAHKIPRPHNKKGKNQKKEGKKLSPDGRGPKRDGRPPRTLGKNLRQSRLELVSRLPNQTTTRKDHSSKDDGSNDGQYTLLEEAATLTKPVPNHELLPQWQNFHVAT